MMLVKALSATLQGLKATKIEIEADSMRGKPGLSIIGLPEKAVEEAKERISNALANCEVRIKAKKTIVNLAPADLRKTGSNLELGLAVALWQLTLEKQLVAETDLFLGELALDGQLRAIRGALPLVTFAKNHGFKRVFLPRANQEEVQVEAGIEIYALDHLREAVDFFSGCLGLVPLVSKSFVPGTCRIETDFAAIIGQEVAKRCLEIAAAGGHNLLLCGVPGAGKSLLASALPSILPPLKREEAIEITAIYSVCGMVGESGLLTVRPCRSPHHTISAVGLAGGGSNLLPGEISLAHRGILFLDELGEFRRDALEILRQPLETGKITISRASGHVEYPAQVTLIAATNPCPCGYLGSKKRACTCSAPEIARYRRKLSGPILDRLDMQIFVPEVELKQLTRAGVREGEDSAAVRARVVRARERQERRLESWGVLVNQSLTSAQIRAGIPLSAGARKILALAVDKWQLSARSYFKLIKVARTIADLEEEEITVIQERQVAEALRYRQTERTG